MAQCHMIRHWFTTHTSAIFVLLAQFHRRGRSSSLRFSVYTSVMGAMPCPGGTPHCLAQLRMSGLFGWLFVQLREVETSKNVRFVCVILRTVINKRCFYVAVS